MSIPFNIPRDTIQINGEVSRIYVYSNSVSIQIDEPIGVKPTSDFGEIVYSKDTIFTLKPGWVVMIQNYRDPEDSQGCCG